MRRRWSTSVAVTVLSAATVLALPLPAQANWQPWTNLGGETLHSGPGFAITGQVFARNAAGKLTMKDPFSSQTIWTQFGDRPMIGAPAVVRGQPSPWLYPTEVYYRSPDDRVRFVDSEFICHQGAGCWWGQYDGDAGGAVTSAPAATYLQPDRLDLFARGTNGRLQHTWRYGDVSAPWAQWEDLGGISFVESPSAVSWRAGTRLDVFVKGVDNRLWHKWWTSGQGWSGWEDLGGFLTSAPAAIRFHDSRLDVFAKGAGDTLIHKVWDAGTGWSGWEDLGGRFQYAPAVVKTGDRRIDVHVTGSTAQLEHLWWG